MNSVVCTIKSVLYETILIFLTLQNVSVQKNAFDNNIIPTIKSIALYLKI